MATQLAKAFVQIVPSAEGIKGSIENVLSEESESAGQKSGGRFSESFGNILKSSAKIAAGAVAAGTVVSGALVKSAVDGFADYEQLTGGIETLFKESSGVVMENASKAFQTAGMSANEYMENVTSFSASLLSSLGGDTSAAANVADMALRDISDNANKMGTDMESVQMAYQGFAKGQYQLLDNLKLGYGGTKGEMERLLQDAEAFSGVKYDINNLNDVYQAIHVIQDEMGITGTTAKEAATTISGSLGMTKAAWSDLTVAMAGGGDLSAAIDNFVSSALTLGTNVMPVMKQAISGLATLISELAPVIASELPNLIQQILPGLLSAAKNVVVNLAQGIVSSLPVLIPAATQIILELVQSIVQMLPLILKAGIAVIVQLALGIANALPELIPTIVDVALTIVDTLIDNVDLLVDAAVALMVGLAVGIINALPKLIEKAPEIVIKLAQAIITNLPKLIQAGFELIKTLASGIITNLPTLIASVPRIISEIVSALSSGISSIMSIGGNIVEGLWNGINNKVTWLKDKITGFARSALDAIKSFFGIHSPSRVMRDEVGKWIPAGLAVGIEANADSVYTTMNKLGNGLLDTTITGSIRNDNTEEMMYRAFSAALNDHKISFNNRELGRLVRSYA